MSNQFKDFIVKLFAEDGSRRPTIDEIRAHPWMQIEKNNQDQVRKNLKAKVTELRQPAPPSPLCNEIRKSALKQSDAYSMKTQAVAN